jgi:methylmalonyl-CoA mutase
LHTNALDEAIALPTDFSARIARNTQIIYRRNKITKTVDPWAGSYYVERLTHEIATMLGSLLKKWKSLGMTKPSKRGFQNLELKKQLHENKHIDSGQDIIVGVNKYRLEKKILSHSRCGQPNGSQTTIRTDRIKASRDTEKTGTTAKTDRLRKDRKETY